MLGGDDLGGSLEQEETVGAASEARADRKECRASGVRWGSGQGPWEPELAQGPVRHCWLLEPGRQRALG